MRPIALDTNTYVGFKRGEAACVEVIPLGLETADSYALLYRSLRRQGTPIPSNDLWIAASCLEHGALLFSLDAHFERVPGLRLIRCWAEVMP